MLKLKKQPALVCPIDAIRASARPMAVFNGFYESPGPSPLVDVRGIVPPHRDDHRIGHQSGYIIHCYFVCCRPGGRQGDTRTDYYYQPWQWRGRTQKNSQLST
jgi:hypothetical protein